MSRITQVFYGNDCLPYKDSERTVHYPITGSSFAGSSNVNELHFYTRDIGGVNNLSWVAIVKLPNGKILYQLLTDIHYDSEINEYYVSFNLSQFYTQLKGDTYISLNGCLGQVEIETDEETNISTIQGEIDSRTVVATGAVKFTINYAPQRPIGYSFDLDQYQTIIQALANKTNIISTFQIVADISTETLTNYEEGQVFYDIATKRFYKKSDGSYVDYNFITSNQANVSIIVNTTTNINGRVFVHFTSVTTTIGGASAYQIKYDGENTTEEQAREYMAYMTGSSYLPKYNYDRPANTYFLTPDGQLLKPQYDSTNGLVLFVMPQLALKNYVDENFVPYTGATKNVNLGERDITAKHFYKQGSFGNNELVTKNELDSAIETIKRNSYINVDILRYPTLQSFLASEGEEGDIYLYPINTSESPTFESGYYQYIWENNQWQDLGTTQIDLSNYYTKPQTNSLLNGKVDKTSSTKKLYGTNGSGNQDTIDYGPGTNNNYIVQRDSAGQVFVPLTPTSNTHASSKGYTDGFAKDLALSLDQSTYVLTVTLKNASGGNIVTRTIDLPLETMVVSGSYDEINKAIILILKNGQTISIPVGDIIDGLVSQTDLANALANYFTKAEIVANYYSSESVTNLSTMAELRTFIDNINARGEHCFFDLHNYVNNAYVCIIHMWAENGIKYCFVQDLINHKTYGNYSGYTDSDTIANYLSGNAMANIKVIKVTDSTITLADIASLLQEINTLGDYVMFDVSSITHAMYLTTIFINGNYYRIYDSVTGRTASGTSTTSLSETLVSVIEGGITTPTTFAEISQLVQEGNASLVYSAGDNILPLKVVKSAVATSSSSSLTVTCDMDDFAEKVSYSSGSYEFTYSSSLGGWVGSGEAVVTLSEYGITVTGTPANGNVITVVLVCDELPLVVMGHNQEESANGDFTNSMTVATEYASDEDWQFDAREAFYSNNTGAVIPSGTTLHFTLGEHSWFADDVGKTFQLTLPVDLPVGGQLVWVQAYNATLVNASVQIFNSPTDTTVRGTATMTEGSAGTNLGTINNGMTEGTGINQCQRALLGNNDWEESAMRQGLSDMSIGGWQPKNIWDRPPSWNTTRAGFLKHLQRDFLAVIGECNKLTEKVQFNASGISGAPRRITADKAWLFSREEIQSESQAEYNLYPSYTYWHNLLGSTYGDWRTDSRFIMTDKNGTARYIWLRSPSTGYGYRVRLVYTTGNVGSDNANVANRVLVCFAIK